MGVSDISSLSLKDIKIAEKCIFIKKRKRKTGEPRDDSIKRAKDSIFDYTLNNRFDYFFTGTIDPKKLNSKDPKALLKPVQNWLKDRVKRDGFKYILIAEHHKSGAIHFHGLIKCGELDFVDSGTKSYRGIKYPIKDHTAIRKGLNPDDGQIVYNLVKWKFGFTTCIKTYGDPLNVAYYITKYITKDCKKIFGKFFWHSRDLKKPEISVDYFDYDSIEAVEFKGTFKYQFVCGDVTRSFLLDIVQNEDEIIFDGTICYSALTGEVYSEVSSPPSDYELILDINDY
ncbi:MAG: hypothetical protein K2J08_09950 [Ruminococcus sp.]|nr:hypothetical protein [Ruminococcus sp.]